MGDLCPRLGGHCHVRHVVCRKSVRGKGVRAEKSWTSSRRASPSAQALAVSPTCFARQLARPQLALCPGSASTCPPIARLLLCSILARDASCFRSFPFLSPFFRPRECYNKLQSFLLLVAFSALSTGLLSRRSPINSTISGASLLRPTMSFPFPAPSICGPERSRSRRWTA